MSKELEKLLRDADAAIEPPKVSSLAERVRRAKARSDARRRYVMAVLVVTGIGGVLSMVFESKNQKFVDTAAVRMEIAQLADEAKVRTDLVERLLERERQQKHLIARRKILAPPIETEIDRAAFAMVYQADRMARNPALREAAIAAYREVSSDFPMTPSAQVAKQRLQTLVERKEG